MLIYILFFLHNTFPTKYLIYTERLAYSILSLYKIHSIGENAWNFLKMHLKAFKHRYTTKCDLWFSWKPFTATVNQMDKFESAVFSCIAGHYETSDYTLPWSSFRQALRMFLPKTFQNLPRAAKLCSKLISFLFICSTAYSNTLYISFLLQNILILSKYIKSIHIPGKKY